MKHNIAHILAQRLLVKIFNHVLKDLAIKFADDTLNFLFEI